MRRPERSILSALAIGLILGALGAAVASAQPAIAIDPAAVDFGDVAIGEDEELEIEVRNLGDEPLEVSEVRRCAGTSAEFGSRKKPLRIGPGRDKDLEVEYEPEDEGADAGCLEIVSNDPVNGVVVLDLAGVGIAGAGGDPDVHLKPDEVDFGEVSIGSTAIRTVKVQNRSGVPLEDVILNRCFGTSDEFTWEPLDLFTVDPDESEKVKVFYEPTDVGSDEGCLEVRSNDPDESPIEIEVSGFGVEGPAGEVDLDIKGFRVTKQVEIPADEPIKIRLQVRNGGDTDEPREATVSGLQNGATVYEETLMVSRRSRNRGVKQFDFPPYLPLEAGDILWMAVIDDDDDDVDEALAVTRVVDPDAAPSAGVDLDVVKFKAKKKVKLGSSSRVWLKLGFENHGTVDEPRTATLVGEQDGVEVYREELEISDDPGDDETTKVRFPRYEPEAPGQIVWTLSIDDGDADLDMALAITRVLP